MSKPRPRFVISEVVGVPNALLGLTRNEVLKMEFRWDAHGQPMGWYYRVKARSTWMCERTLMKLPAEERTQWKHCIWQPGGVK